MLFISFCSAPHSSELYESADEVIPSSENEDEIVTTSSTTTSTISSTTTTLANDYILHLEVITAEKIWLIDFARRVNKAIYEWNEPKTLTYQEYKKILSSFIEEAQEFNEKVRGIEPPNKYDFLKVSQIDLNLLSDIILADIVELLAGAEEPDTGQRSAAALSSFNFNSEAFVNKVSEIVTLSLSPTTSLITTTTTTIAPTATTSSTTTTTIAPTTSTTAPSTTTTVVRSIPANAPEINIESIDMTFKNETLSIEVLFKSSRLLTSKEYVNSTSLGCLGNETADTCVSNIKTIRQVHDSHHPEASVGNGRTSVCADYHGLTAEESLTHLGGGRYKYICKKYEFNHSEFVFKSIGFGDSRFYSMQISFSEVNLSGFGYDSDANSCFNNTKGWYVKYRSFDYRDKESDDYELCIDFVDSITFNNKTYTDGSILYLEN